MGAAFLQKVCRHLLVQRLSHVGQVSAFFPESKFAATVCTTKAELALMYRVSADRAASYVYLIMMGSCRDGRNLPQVSQHLIEQSVDALHKIMGLDLAAFHPQQVIFPFSCHAGGFQVVRDIANCGYTVLRGNHLFAFTLYIAGGYQFFQNRSARCRGSQTFLLSVLFKFLVACGFHGRQQSIFGIDFRR